jgi:thioesterase domain-containing protein
LSLADSLQIVLNERIPLTKAMQLKVEEASSRIVLSAPLKPNLNHLETAFGGSLYSLAVLAGWSWIWLHMHEQGLKGQIMIRSSEIEYRGPVESDFRAICVGTEAMDWERALRSLERRGMAKISLQSWVESEDKRAVLFNGDYAIVR